MPEGDTIHMAARRVGKALTGAPIESIETPHPRHGKDRWPERLDGAGVRSVDAHGKNLFLRFDNDLTLYSHLRMGGSWGVYPRGGRWHRGRHRAWLVIKTGSAEVVQFDGPVLELMTDSRTRFDNRLTQLGPDILAAGEFDEQDFLRRLRSDDYTRGIGDALLDQRIIAGIGNIWKSEGCFMARLDPWRKVGDVTDAQALAVVRADRPLMQLSVEQGRPVTWQPERPPRGKENRYWVYNRDGKPCRVCGTPISARGQGDGNRTTFWCQSCQK